MVVRGQRHVPAGLPPGYRPGAHFPRHTPVYIITILGFNQTFSPLCIHISTPLPSVHKFLVIYSHYTTWPSEGINLSEGKIENVLLLSSLLGFLVFLFSHYSFTNFMCFFIKLNFLLEQ